MAVQSICRPGREEGAYRAYVTDEQKDEQRRGCMVSARPGAARVFFDSLLGRVAVEAVGALPLVAALPAVAVGVDVTGVREGA